MSQLRESMETLLEATGLKLELVKSKHGPTYKINISGSVGRIEVVGKTTSYHHGIDKLTPRLVGQITNVNRADGSGKAVPTGAYMKIEKAVMAKLASIK